MSYSSIPSFKASKAVKVYAQDMIYLMKYWRLIL
jgi:hypothetical protein